MRVTNNMLINSMLYNLNRNLSVMSHQQDMLASGKKVMRPSDDPVATSKILKYKTDIQELEQYDTNTEDALAWLNTTETAIEDIGNILQRLRELAVQGSTETLTTGDRQKIAEEVSQMKKEIISSGNATFAGRYIFSGYQTNDPLFNDDGTFNIDITDHELNNAPITIYEIGIGETLEVSTNGLDVFGYVPLDNFFTQKIAVGDGAGGTEATKTQVTGNFDFRGTYGVGDLDTTVNGTLYENTTALNGSGYAIDKDEIINAMENADDGAGNLLKDVADIYFDLDDNLVIKSKSFGTDTITTAGVYSVAPTTTLGNITGTTTVSGANTITSAEVAASTDNEEIFISLNGEEASFYIDMSAVANVTQLETAIQAQLDLEFGAGTVTVTVPEGGLMTFETATPQNEGEVPTLSVNVKKASESQLLVDIQEFIDGLMIGETNAISNFMTEVDVHIENLLGQRSDIGARSNRMELILNRIAENSINFTQLLSNAEDADMSEVIMKLKNSENVYRASLSAGARVIQPTLMDFLG